MLGIALLSFLSYLILNMYDIMICIMVHYDAINIFLKLTLSATTIRKDFIWTPEKKWWKIKKHNFFWNLYIMQINLFTQKPREEACPNGKQN